MLTRNLNQTWGGSALAGLSLLLVLVRVQTLSAALPYPGPDAFGMEEFRAAEKARGLTLSLDTELDLRQPETYKIVVVAPQVLRISGGDLRGLMYGLIDAAEQIRDTGTVVSGEGEPGLAERGVRFAPTDGDLASPGFFGSDRWRSLFQLLARNRVNRFTLVLPLTQLEYTRISFLSRTAAESGVDLILGLRLPATVPADVRPLYGQLRQVLDQAVLVRGVEIQVGREPLSFYQNAIFPAIRGTGRRITLDLHGVEARPDLVNAAMAQGIALRVGSGRGPAKLGIAAAHSVVVPASVASGSDADIQAARAQVAAIANGDHTGFEVDVPGPNIEQYQRFYWAWGRAGYDYKAPGTAVAGSKARGK